MSNEPNEPKDPHSLEAKLSASESLNKYYVSRIHTLSGELDIYKPKSPLVSVQPYEFHWHRDPLSDAELSSLFPEGTDHVNSHFMMFDTTGIFGIVVEAHGQIWELTKGEYYEFIEEFRIVPLQLVMEGEIADPKQS